MAGKNNIKVAIENLPPGFIADNINELEYIINEVKKDSLYYDNVGICLDTGHAFLNEELFDYLNYFQKDIIYMHVHDNYGDMNGDKIKVVDDLHNPPGIGEINWDKFLYKLNSYYFKGPICFELKDVMTKKGEDSLYILSKFIKSKILI